MDSEAGWQQPPFYPQYEDGAELFRARLQIRIAECAEILSEIPEGKIARVDPHPYTAVGAPYHGVSPFFLRVGVLERLIEAQRSLHVLRPGHRLYIWDGYRPLAVQRYMVEHSIAECAREEGLDPEAISSSDRERLEQKVFLIWARPSADPLAPPPHSTGGAIDLTIVDEAGAELDMGSPIDAFPPLCLPYAFADRDDEAGRRIHENRLLLREVMCRAGFRQLPHEWWHFSYGDQIWAALMRLETGDDSITALYGRYDLAPRH